MKLSGWSFPVELTGDVSLGGPADLRVHLAEASEGQAEQRNRAMATGTWFGWLADLGAYCGDNIRPQDSTAKLPNGEWPEEVGRVLHWHFETLRIDPLGVASLLNLMQESGVGIDRVEWTAQGDDPAHPPAPGQYPASSGQLGFPVHGGLTSRDLEFEILFVSDLSGELEETISEALKLWSLVAMLGGYRDAVAPGEVSEIAVADDPEVLLDSVRLLIRDRGVHEGAYDGLLNMLGKVSATLSPVSELTIS